MPIPLLSRLFCAALAIISLSAYTPKEPTPSRASAMESDILRFVNQHRRSIRLKPLQLNAAESAVAAQHSRDMASGRAPFGHTGIPARKQAIARQVGPLMSFGENVAYGQMSAKEVVNEWLHSPGHRRNIEGNFRLTGIGLARDRQGQIYYTQIFTR